MSRNSIILIAIAGSFLILFFFILKRDGVDTDSKSADYSAPQSKEYKQALNILNKIKSQTEIPDSRIDNAIITMADDDYVTTKIKCDTLIKYDRKPTLLIGSIEATFYDSIGPLSILRSDFAEYDENASLVAKKNITMYNLRKKDSLFFVDQDVSEIIWFKNYGRITSDNDFILKDSTSTCTKGSKFESNIDLSEITILNSQGTSSCK